MNDEHIARIAQDDQTDAAARVYVRSLLREGKFLDAMDLANELGDTLMQDDDPRSRHLVGVLALGMGLALRLQTEIEAEGEAEGGSDE